MRVPELSRISLSLAPPLPTTKPAFEWSSTKIYFLFFQKLYKSFCESHDIDAPFDVKFGKESKYNDGGKKCTIVVFSVCDISAMMVTMTWMATVMAFNWPDRNQKIKTCTRMTKTVKNTYWLSIFKSHHLRLHKKIVPRRITRRSEIWAFSISSIVWKLKSAPVLRDLHFVFERDANKMMRNCYV